MKSAAVDFLILAIAVAILGYMFAEQMAEIIKIRDV